MLVPDGNTFLVHPMAFAGPCKPTSISFLVRECRKVFRLIPPSPSLSLSLFCFLLQISGIIIAPDSPESWKGRNQGRWLIFKGVDGLSVDGPGMLDGRGKGWWDILCATHRHLPGCVKLAPTVISFLHCNKVSLSNILVVDSPQTHILITGCNNVVIRYLSIKSPETSPNTDGIHISSSHGVFIHNTNIGSGDDCVSIGDHTSDIYITDVDCGPGHGVSIGSLGRSGNEVKVNNINVIRVRFNKTTNGVRIKTWQVGRGHVRGVLYEDINFMDVSNPIIIDQYYCDVRGGCESTRTGVQISDVRYAGIFGTSKSKVAINLNCSQAVACTDILLDTILLAPSTPGKKVISSCNNAYGSSAGIVEPESCLL
ncbi:probable polygalacturonase At1g80170 isoform X1 [Actinidia eriantha]|uniref:probable polygalacturonase At1g80170 isoform X1 n=1 Tax=Actinidia eriantha TaxID=165200 RepID=UPI00258A7B58|nr:probable polygalacturonase At1g80170 isoform X1 [Actinidia eriantha]XP_057504257.1 probable polygalacturonase At1g80170 isoform X1 [Actinidia eriantha]